MTSAVLLLAYGSPDRLEDVGDYFRHIRGGRTPSPEAVAHLRERYASIGGRTPLLEITRATARALEQRLNDGSRRWATASGDGVRPPRIWRK